MASTRTQNIPMDIHALEAMRGKTVLITGGGGSIGSHLCQMLVEYVDKLIIVSISESALYRVKKLLGNSGKVSGVLADYGDLMAMGNVLPGVDIVIHAGAHKHVPICEENPLAAIMNNVWGTQKLLNQCVVHGVKQFLQISTDKAVNPTSIMGATKRVCELICTRTNHGDVKVSVVRFGNVIGSDGSVIPLWKEQIAAGGPLTLTDKNCERFFMTLDDACRLILAVLFMGAPGLFVFDMGKPVHMGKLAEEMVLANGGNIEIKEIGLRPGEKLVEELVHGGTLQPTTHQKVLKVIEGGLLQPSHYLVPDLVEHARRNRVAEAINVLWDIVNNAVRTKQP